MWFHPPPLKLVPHLGCEKLVPDGETAELQPVNEQVVLLLLFPLVDLWAVGHACHVSASMRSKRQLHVPIGVIVVGHSCFEIKMLEQKRRQ